MRSKGMKLLILGMVMVILIVGYYYYLSNVRVKKVISTGDKITAVQDILLRDLSTSYPPSPKEVVRFYEYVTQCLYNATYTDEEFMALTLQIQRLYDEELIANQTPEQYIENLKWDINQIRQKKIIITSYAASVSTDVDYFKKDGYECARLIGTLSIRQGNRYGSNKNTFVLRKDEAGHWKILGWKRIEQTDHTAQESDIE